MFCVAALVLLLLHKFKPDLSKKVWGYVVAAIVTVSGVFFLFGRRKKEAPTDDKIRRKEEKLREDLQRVHEEAEEEIRQAAEKEEEVKKELEAIQEIDDEELRLSRLADLFNRTRRGE